MSDPYLIDTNVWVVGSRPKSETKCTDACAEACFQFLLMIKESAASVVLDQASFESEAVPGNSVLQELKNNLRENDFGYELLWHHLFRDGRFDVIELCYDESGAVLPEGMEVWQEEPSGKKNLLEPSDRKWVALHLEHEMHPPIHNAADGDWEKARKDLNRHGIRVIQLCEGDCR